MQRNKSMETSLDIKHTSRFGSVGGYEQGNLGAQYPRGKWRPGTTVNDCACVFTSAFQP